MKNGILVASFGTTYKEARQLSLEAIEHAVYSAFPDFTVYEAYTSNIVKKRIQENEGLFIPGIPQALQNMYKDGIKNIYIQPTHMIPGMEYGKILNLASQYKNKFNVLKIDRKSVV